MFKKYLLILLLLASFFVKSTEATPKVDSGKNKKSSKGKKEKKNAVENNQKVQEADADFDQELSCSCSCETLQIPKKGKKAELKVQNKQQTSSRKEGAGEIKRRKVPLREGQSRFKSLKKPYTDQKANVQEEGTKQQTTTQTKQQIPKQKTKVQKGREQGKSRRKQVESKQDQQEI